MRHLCQIGLFFFSLNSLLAQPLTGIQTRWNDSFVEWDLIGTTPPADSTEEPEDFVSGSLQLRWLTLREDWSEWEFKLGDTLSGTIKQIWKTDPTQWELRTYTNQVVTMRIAWPGDLSEWRVTDNSLSLHFKSRWTNQWDEWLARDEHHGQFYVYTLRERDPRDWTIKDELESEISTPMKLAMLFLAIYHASPKQ